MRVEGFTTGRFQANCFIAASQQGSAAVVVDPGEEAREVLEARLDELGLRLEAVLLTHGHVDHAWDAAAFADAAGVPAFLHPADRWMFEDVYAAIGAAGGPPMALPKDLRDLSDGDELRFGGLTFRVAHTPGHTPGHCTFATDGVLFSGDLIFAGSVGRTDFPRGSTEELLDSIGRAVLPLPDDTVIHSGHGPATTVGVERRTNPFVLQGVLPRARGL
jgi:hydroxyacylglutathione hydrolase